MTFLGLLLVPLLPFFRNEKQNIYCKYKSYSCMSESFMVCYVGSDYHKPDPNSRTLNMNWGEKDLIEGQRPWDKTYIVL